MFNLTIRGLISRVFFSGFFGLLACLFLIITGFEMDWPALLAMTLLFILLALFRNQLLKFVYRRISYATHDKVRGFVVPVFGVIGGLALGLVWAAFYTSFLQQKASGLVLGTVLFICAAASAIGRVLSDRGETGLLFAQCMYETSKGRNFPEVFRWLDRALYSLVRLLKQYGLRVHAPTQRLGARLYCLSNDDLGFLRDVSQAVLHIEKCDQFSKLREAVETFEEIGQKEISKGISSQPRFADYLDTRNVSLENLSRILVIISVAVVLLLYAYCWIFKITQCPVINLRP
jgi:hypothetical protein